MSPRSLVTLVSFAFLLALAPASASTLEEATGHFVAYQFDGDSHHDAPDTCAAAAPEWSGRLGSSTDGILVAPDDVSDVFLVDVPAESRGARVTVRLSEAQDLQNLEVTAFLPGCAGSVLDRLNWPTPEPSPPAPRAGERQASANVSAPLRCYAGQQAFGLSRVSGYQPAPSIHVAWTDGSQLDVPVTFTPGDANALYVTDHSLGTTLKGAWVNMPGGWTGDFAYVAGPCNAVDGGAVYGEPPVVGVGSLAFTPIKSGPHVVQVTYRGAAGVRPMPVPAPASFDPEPYLPFEPSDVVTGALADPGSLVPPPPQPPGMYAPRSCHACVREVGDLIGQIAYRLSFFAS
ncbi:MAG TPA: hypothetical protein VM241_05150 [Candidatus Thermoplasmatota archaeon]|nr:hypothetical protein [Candidatus Thermoplasmatota archaeon]